MVSDNSIMKIIRQEPGQTGETLYQTEDGTWWRSVQFKTAYRTGQITATKIDGYLKRD